MNTERPCDISLITEAVPVDELMEVIIESVDEFQSENLAQEVSQGSGRQPPVVSGSPATQYGYKICVQHWA